MSFNVSCDASGGGSSCDDSAVEGSMPFEYVVSRPPRGDATDDFMLL